LAGLRPQTYTSVTGDVGHQIRCQVTAINAGGSGSATSNAVSIVNPVPVGSVLRALALSSSSVAENSAAGVFVGAVLNTASGSTLTLSNDAGGRFVLDGSNNIVTGLVATNFEAATSHSIAIVETLAGDVGSPLTTNVTINVTNVLEVVLGDLSGTFALSESAAAGAVAGTLSGMTSGGTIGLVDNAGGRVGMSGINIVRGSTALDFEAATSHTFTVRETHPDASNSPHDTTLVLAVSNVFEQPNLQALALSLTTFTTGSTTSGSIDNAAAGSTIVATGLPASLTINSGARTWSYNGTGSVSSGSFTLTETLSDSANSPVPRRSITRSSLRARLLLPVLSLFSTANTVPVVFSVTDSDYVAGMYAQLQIATDSGFTSVTQDSGAVFIGGAEWASLDAVFPFSDPTGTYYARVRFLRENPGGATVVTSVSGAVGNYDATPWSNTITDTITVSVAKFVGATGTGKSRWITTYNSDFSCYYNANVGIAAGAKASIAAAFSKWHAEFRLDNWNSVSGSIRVGVTDGTTDFNAGTGYFGGTGSAALPGSSPGFTITVNKAATSFTFTGAGGGTVTLPGGIVTEVNDRIIMEGDTSTNQIKFYYWDDSAGALVSAGAAIATKTLSGTGIPSSYYVWGGGIKGSGGNPAASDGVTFFPVSDKMAYSTGYAMYG
jgi:hypothetical protein